MPSGCPVADTLEQIAAKVAAEIDGEPAKVAKEPAKAAREPAQEAPDDADDGDAAPELSPAQKARAEAESDARKRGWMPKDEWIESGKDEDDWSSAKQFLKKGEEIEDRKQLRKKLDGLTKQNDELATLLKKRLEKEQNAELAKKAAERDAAIEAGDKAKVYAIEREMVAVQPVEATPAEIRDFVQENKEWWGVDVPATQAAVVYYGKLEAENRDAIADNLAKTKKFLALRFPDLYQADRKDAAEAAQAIVEQQPTRKLSSVSLPSGTGSSIKRGKGWSDIPSDARRVAEQILKSTGMTKDQYAKDFFGEA